MEPDPAFHFNADPDPGPDPAFNFTVEPDPAPHQSDENLRPLVYQNLQRFILSHHSTIVSTISWIRIRNKEF
jgi:hypothetical protein